MQKNLEKRAPGSDQTRDLYFTLYHRSLFLYNYNINIIVSIFRDQPFVETVELNDTLVNPPNCKVGPQDFQLLKVLGKGGYGKVRL